tara:strand:- start:345 stop:1418 length:1074 start_codon:yes stop_codon:yes gene_type:complete
MKTKIRKIFFNKKPKKLKVAIFIKYFFPSYGGPYFVIQETVKELKKENIKIEIFSCDSEFLKRKKLSINQVKNFDICHFYGGWNFFYIKWYLIALFFRKKIIFHPFGIFEPWALNQKKIKKKIAWFFYQNKMLEKSDLVQCVSLNEEKNILKLNQNINTYVLPYGIAKKRIKKKISKKNIKKKILFLSRIHEKKGLENLIKVWNSINNSEWELDIVGPSDDFLFLKKLKKLARKKELKINFMEPIYEKNKKDKLFDSYDLLILPTKNDPFGMVILESMARGLPVLTNKNTPWSEIKDYDAGWYINSDINSLKNTLKKIFNLKKFQFTKKSINSTNLAKKYSWDIISKKYRLMYLSLI